MPRTVFGVTKLSLGLEDPEERADRSGVGWILELVANLPRGRAAKSINHVHDFALASRE